MSASLTILAVSAMLGAAVALPGLLPAAMAWGWVALVAAKLVTIGWAVTSLLRERG